MLRLKEMTKTIWVTHDGRRMRVLHMDSNHLKNTIMFLRRNVFALRLSLNKFTAKDLKTTDDAFLLRVVPCYALMLSQAKKRNLFDLQSRGQYAEMLAAEAHHVRNEASY